MPVKSGTSALLAWCQRNTEGFKDGLLSPSPLLPMCPHNAC